VKTLIVAPEVATTLLAGRCDSRTSTDCEATDSASRQSLEQACPDFVPVDYVTGGACDGSGDGLALVSKDNLTAADAANIKRFMNDKGWMFEGRDDTLGQDTWTRSDAAGALTTYLWLDDGEYQLWLSMAP
jgi:hypothetical protein